ncbi:hypothetical protein GOODEAATRI_029782 [Goodea atripinnis]|uniref:Uncharacterized protein n=1 Tax=Goodea atripinnis TaxID=208336 RepID=A0ABV0MWI3_9TELE
MVFAHSRGLGTLNVRLNYHDFSKLFTSFECCCSTDMLPTTCVANGQQGSSRSPLFTTSSNRRSFYLLLAGFNSTWSWSRCFIYGNPNNATSVDVLGLPE